MRVPRGKRISSRYWEDVVLAVVGNQFDVPVDEICGAVISSRNQFDMLSVWIKHADNEEYKAIIEESLKKVMKLPSGFKVEFKPHDETIKDSSNPNPAPTQINSNPRQNNNQRSPQKKRNNNDSNNNRNNNMSGDREAGEGDEKAVEDADEEK